MSQKRIILSDSSLNRYGYRVLTAGLLLEAFIAFSFGIVNAGTIFVSIPAASKTEEERSYKRTAWELAGISTMEASMTSAENLDSIHAEMERLKTENATLVQAKADIEEKLNSANAKITELNGSTSGKDNEISTLKNSITEKDSKITQLEEQVKNLKNGPTPGHAGLTPEQEPEGSGTQEELSAFCDQNAGNYQAITEKLKAEGLY